ncbi:hypothetical protein [Cellulomonas wangsupingiae]|uniref:hypothetical protein n=1 Tax=Cellulomonas wangsupingiae TaxID=2968085 RepID=UPI001D0DCB36|nr:hypothetical protein [Cellulomonas wangsupingiae]MCC2334171.1 hypothetical protein [Cellulomonas wangsupingiae]
MTTRLLLEGPDLSELVAQVREQLGPGARIVRAERVRSGGFAGFFATERFEVTVDVPDEVPRPSRVAAPRPAAAAPVGGIDGLLAAAPAPAPPPPPDPTPALDPDAPAAVSTTSREFAAVLDQVRTLVGVPLPDVVVPAPARAAALTGPRARPPVPATAPPARPADAADAGPADAGANGGLRAELLRLGVPARLLGPGPVTLGAVLGRLPAPPAPPRGVGQVLVVAGEGDGPLTVARTLALRWRLPDARVHEVDAGGPVTALPRDGGTAQVVALRTGHEHQDRARAARALAVLGADQVWAVVDARTKPADVAAWVAAVGVERRVDALAVHGLLDTAAPGTVLEAGVPVAWVDGVPASRLVWAAALGQELDTALG